MENDGWQPARLIPTSGINGPDEAERRATSALLAVLHAVREFRVATLKRFGAPAGVLECFIEVPLHLDEEEPSFLTASSGDSRQDPVDSLGRGQDGFRRAPA